MDNVLNSAFMNKHGTEFVAFEALIVNARNLVAAIVCLKATLLKLPSSNDPKQLVRDTKKKIATVPGAVCPVDLMNRLTAAGNAMTVSAE